jgi:prepilin-type processing-associated H-X9-DG protein
MTDRWDKTLTNTSNETQFSSYKSMPLYTEKDVRQNDNVNPYVHFMGGNYLFADGHGEWISYKDLKWKSFVLRAEDITEAQREYGPLAQP